MPLFRLGAGSTSQLLLGADRYNTKVSAKTEAEQNLKSPFIYLSKFLIPIHNSLTVCCSRLQTKEIADGDVCYEALKKRSHST